MTCFRNSFLVAHSCTRGLLIILVFSGNRHSTVGRETKAAIAIADCTSQLQELWSFARDYLAKFHDDKSTGGAQNAFQHWYASRIKFLIIISRLNVYLCDCNIIESVTKRKRKKKNKELYYKVKKNLHNWKNESSCDTWMKN